MTDLFILESLNLKIDDELTLLELDDLVERFIDNEGIETPLTAFGYEEVLRWKEYIFYTEEGDYPYYKINFEIIKNTDNENSIIKIIK